MTEDSRIHFDVGFESYDVTRSEVITECGIIGQNVIETVTIGIGTRMKIVYTIPLRTGTRIV